MADFCGAENAALVRADQLTQRSSVVAPRADSAVIDAYNRQWWAQDPTVKATSTAPVGRITSLADTGRDVFHQSVFHNEFWFRSGLGAERFAVNLSRGKHHFASCVLQASSTRDRLDHQAEKRFALLTPHLIRAVQIQDRLQRLSIENSILNALQDKQRLGLMVVDAAMRVVFADKAGEALLADGSGVRFRSSTFGLRDPRAHGLLQRAVFACAGHYSQLPTTHDISWNRGNGAKPLNIEIVPWSSASTTIELPGSWPAAILLFQEPKAVTARAETQDAAGEAQTFLAVSRSRTRAELLSALKRDVDANLGDCELSLLWLAKRHRLTPRRIRDLFYSKNTNFTEYLLNTRLDRARELLANPTLARVNVASIAFDCGFGDISWFHYAFRRRFQVTPADMRNRLQICQDRTKD